MSINVGVFFGGSSVEHEISVISALQAIHAMDNNKYHIVPIYISKNGTMYTGKDLFDIDNYSDTDKLLAACNQITLGRSGESVFAFRNPPKRFGNNILSRIDVAFPIVHGTNCEDGTIQGFLELLKIPYVGSDIISSAIGMDKIITKQVLKENDIPMLDYISFYSREWRKQNEPILNEIETRLRYPVIVKPANLGSSIGIQKADNRYELEEAIDLAESFANKILIENAIIKLKEVNCAVLGDYENAYASLCEEPIGSDEILSYSDKYMSKGSNKGMRSTMRKLPAELSADTEKYILELAVKTFKTVGCNGVVRIDFLIDLENNDKVYVNELNTIPGSLAFYLWEPTGKSFSQLLDDLIALAFKRDREKQQLLSTFSSNIFTLKGSKGLKA